MLSCALPALSPMPHCSPKRPIATATPADSGCSRTARRRPRRRATLSVWATRTAHCTSPSSAADTADATQLTAINDCLCVSSRSRWRSCNPTLRPSRAAPAIQRPLRPERARAWCAWRRPRRKNLCCGLPGKLRSDRPRRFTTHPPLSRPLCRRIDLSDFPGLPGSNDSYDC
jgi:hypothetical protein